MVNRPGGRHPILTFAAHLISNAVVVVFLWAGLYFLEFLYRKFLVDSFQGDELFRVILDSSFETTNFILLAQFLILTVFDIIALRVKPDHASTTLVKEEGAYNTIGRADG